MAEIISWLVQYIAHIRPTYFINRKQDKQNSLMNLIHAAGTNVTKLRGGGMLVQMSYLKVSQLNCTEKFIWIPNYTYAYPHNVMCLFEQVVKEFLPAMIDRNEGHIVTVSSMAGKGGSHFLTDYWYVPLFSVALQSFTKHWLSIPMTNELLIG